MNNNVLGMWMHNESHTIAALVLVSMAPPCNVLALWLEFQHGAVSQYHTGGGQFQVHM